MSPATRGEDGFRVGPWSVEPKGGLLRRGADLVRVEPKVMDVLVYFAERAGEVVSREEPERDVWRGALVGYDAVTKTVTTLRQALRDDPRNPRYVQTVPKRGYRLFPPTPGWRPTP
jgi:DNA-binding winged helix-turn-helix (wHTH) protein